MEDHEMTDVDCLECHKKIRTEEMKLLGEKYSCSHCGCEHTVFFDEAEGCWYPKVIKSD